jgi:hypothetical protein
MRRRSFNRPKEKLRGINRRLKSIDNWAESFNGYFPEEYSTEKYMNYKIPVLDRLVNTPTTTKNIQAHCLKAILKATAYIEKAKPKKLNNSIVTVLVTYPDMFSSEICIFFNEEYFRTFFERNNETEKLIQLSGKSLAQDLEVDIPANFKEIGFQFTVKDDSDIFNEEWWSYRA